MDVTCSGSGAGRLVARLTGVGVCGVGSAEGPTGVGSRWLTAASFGGTDELDAISRRSTGGEVAAATAVLVRGAAAACWSATTSALSPET